MRHLHLVGSVVALAALALAPAASAQTEIGSSRRIGLGLALGYPNVGLGMNFFLSQSTSVQVDVSWGWRSESRGLFARADFMIWFPTLTQGRGGALKWYVAPGAFLGFANGRYCRGDATCGDGVFYLGVEAAIGLAWQFRAVPIDIAVEAVPRLGILDNAGVGAWFDIGGTLHARYYF